MFKISIKIKEENVKVEIKYKIYTVWQKVVASRTKVAMLTITALVWSDILYKYLQKKTRKYETSGLKQIHVIDKYKNCSFITL